MAERPDFPCPHTGASCQNGSCPQTACLYDLDEAVWPDAPCPACHAVTSYVVGPDTESWDCQMCDGSGRIQVPWPLKGEQ